MKRWFATVSLLFLLASCSKEHVAASAPPLVPDETPQEGGTLIRRLDTDVSTMNYVVGTSRNDKDVHWYLYTPLIYLDQELNPMPGLAEKWEISADGKQYTFHLNPKATFDDGSPIRASDAIYTLRQILDPKNESANLAPWFDSVDLPGCRASDEHTVTFSFKEPRAGQIMTFSYLGILPESVYSKGDFRKDFASRAVGSGPYKLKQRIPGTEVLLERREDYWGKKPYIRQILFKVIADDNTAWSAMKRGDIDESYMSSDTWALEGNSPAVQQMMDIHRFYYLAYNFVAWNTQDPILADKRVRRALAMCLDRKSIITNIFHGTARAMTGPFPPDQFGYNPAVPAIEYDPQGALRILAGLGWKDSNGDGILDREGKPFKLTMVVTGGSGSIPFVQAYQAELKKVGIQLVLEELDGAMMIARVLKGDYQCTYLAWDLDADPDPFAIFHSSQIPPRGQNYVFFSNPQADRLIEAGRREMDRSRRLKIYQELHALIAEEQPYLFSLQVSMKWAVNRRVHNVKESRGYGLFLWNPGPLDWYIPARLQRNRAPQKR